MARTCGSCSVCCTLQGVKEGMPDGLPKLPGVSCRYLAAGGCSGCSVYAARPEECSGYACLWLDGHGGPFDRPDKIGVLFELHDQEVPGQPVILARTTARGRERNPRAKKLVRDLRALGNVVIVVHPDQTRGWLIEVEVPEISQQGGVGRRVPG